MRLLTLYQPHLQDDKEKQGKYMLLLRVLTHLRSKGNLGGSIHQLEKNHLDISHAMGAKCCGRRLVIGDSDFMLRYANNLSDFGVVMVP